MPLVLGIRPTQTPTPAVPRQPPTAVPSLSTAAGGLSSAGHAPPRPRDASEGKGPYRWPQQRLYRRLEEVAKAVGSGYCWLQMPLKLAPAVRETVAGHRLGTLEGEGGHLPPPPSNASLAPKAPPRAARPVCGARGQGILKNQSLICKRLLEESHRNLQLQVKLRGEVVVVHVPRAQFKALEADPRYRTSPAFRRRAMAKDGWVSLSDLWDAGGNDPWERMAQYFEQCLALFAALCVGGNTRTLEVVRKYVARASLSIFCAQPICHKEKSTAKRHITFPQHKKVKHDYPKLVKTPGLSAPVESKSEGPEVNNNPATSKPNETLAAPQKQVDLKSLLDGMKHKEMVSDDFAAAFLQAGIPLKKLDHPSICGLFGKYTTVSGCIAKGDTLYRSVDCFHECHIGAVCKISKDSSKVWVGTDEWTDNQGHAIINILENKRTMHCCVKLGAGIHVWRRSLCHVLLILLPFWESQDPILVDAIMPYL